ncbi:hypothetical protein [Mycolicibacterium phlei]
MSLTFYVYLWPRPGMEQALVAYEDTVLALVDEHGGRLVHRSRTDGRDGRPFEIQLFEWPSQAALDGYMADPRRTSLAADRDRAVERTDIVPVQPVVTPAT